MPVLVITVHVFVFIVFVSLDGQTNYAAAGIHTTFTYLPLDSVNCESALIPAGRDVEQQAEIPEVFRFFCKIPKPGHLKHSQPCTSIPAEWP